MGEKRYWAILYQDGIDVASVTGPSKESVDREINHYAMVYSQDGPVKKRAVGLRRWVV